MPRAIVDPQRCRPEKCTEGRCRVRRVCPTKAIVQLDPHEAPATDPGRCHGCSKCLADCPAKAIYLA